MKNNLRKYRIFVIIIFTSYCLACTVSQAFADTSQNDNYIFNMHINTDTDPSDQIYNLPVKKLIQTPTPLPAIHTILPTPLPSPHTSIHIGYTDTEPVNDFSFTLSDTAINFGPLSPSDSIIRENTITVTGDPTYRYTIFALENHQLTDEKNIVIPNTTCDDGQCTQTIASEWKNVLTYGFGYRCDNVQGLDCDANFIDVDNYKQFADASSKAPETTIISGLLTQRKQQKVTYKLNVSGSQQSGYYKNMITYLAMPMY